MTLTSESGRMAALTVSTLAFWVLCVALPVFLGFSSLAAMFTFGRSPDLAERNASAWFAAAGAVSALAGMVVTLVAARTAPRPLTMTLAVFGTILGLVFGGVNALAALSQFSYMSDVAAEQAPPALRPECGVGAASENSAQGPRVRLCEAEIRAGERLAAELTSALPASNVTTESIEELAGAGALPGGLSETGLFDGRPAAVWMPADLTCVNAVWNTTSWTIEVVGVREDGGCLMFDGQWSPGA
ncbi:MAG TPA: hypothetical protein VN200_03075 [Rhodoglobus sp.]|nr:hypothetical protein [Rhodoglobus sp.]